MRRDRHWAPEGSGQLLYVRILIVFALFLIGVFLLPAAWKAWVLGVAMVAVLCGSIIAIFVAGRIKAPRRRRRPKQEPEESAIEDEAMEWEHQRRY